MGEEKTLEQRVAALEAVVFGIVPEVAAPITPEVAPEVAPVTTPEPEKPAETE